MHRAWPRTCREGGGRWHGPRGPTERTSTTTLQVEQQWGKGERGGGARSLKRSKSRMRREMRGAYAVSWHIANSLANTICWLPGLQRHADDEVSAGTHFARMPSRPNAFERLPRCGCCWVSCIPAMSSSGASLPVRGGLRGREESAAVGAWRSSGQSRPAPWPPTLLRSIG